MYLLANLPEVLAQCQAQKKLTITATPTLTEGGHVAVSVGDNGGRAVITVHLKRVKSEGRCFLRPHFEDGKGRALVSKSIVKVRK